MPQADHDQRVDYIEFFAKNLSRTKEFYQSVFGWSFTDYGPEYTTFEDGRLRGGFALADSVKEGGPLIVIYAKDLVATEERIKSAGGAIVKEAFDFPGGRRFHFSDPSGNTLAVWSEK